VVIPAVFLVVLRGSALAPPFFSLVPGQVFWTGIVPIVTREDLTAESTTEGPRAAAFTFVLEDVRAQVRGTAGEGTVVLPLRKTILESAARASTSFGVSVDLTPIADRQLTLLQFFIEENEHVRAAPDRSA